MNQVIFGDCRDTMRDLKALGVRVQCCVTSPPYYGLRDYGHPGQIGLEKTPAEYVAALVEVFDGVRELLADDGVLWLNLGDSYASDKNLIGIPWRVAFALQDRGWTLRQDVIWDKPNGMPEGQANDRCVRAHEYLFMLTKGPRYQWNAAAMKEAASGTDDRPQQRRAKELAAAAGLTDEHLAAIRACGATDAGKALTTQDGAGKNKPNVMALAAEAKAALKGYYREFLMGATRTRRSVWRVPLKPFKGAHFAVFPPDLIRPCIEASSRPGDVVLDPFLGSGTTAQVAQALGRQWIGCELNPEYAPLQQARTAQAALAI